MYGLLGSANIWIFENLEFEGAKMILEQILCKKTIICDYI